MQDTPKPADEGGLSPLVTVVTDPTISHIDSGGQASAPQPDASTKPVQSEEFDAIPDRASVPGWLSYDTSQNRYFGPKEEHEYEFAKMLNPDNYALHFPNFLRKLRDLIRQSNNNQEPETVHCNIISVQVTKRTEQGQSILTLSNLLFDHFAVLNRMPEMLFWCVLSACSCAGITRLVISDPVQLVRNALLPLPEGSDLSWDESLGPSHDLSLSGASIEQLLETVSDEIQETECIDPDASSDQIKLLLLYDDIREGDSITEYCGDNFEIFLARLLKIPRDEFKFEVMSEVAVVRVQTSQTSLMLTHIEIRPCAQRLRLGRIILYVLMCFCRENGYGYFIIDTAFEPTILLCTSMGFTLIPRSTCDYEISRMGMEARAEPEQCGLPTGLISRDSQHRGMFRINWDLFPTNAEMNDQRATDSRGGHSTGGAAQGGRRS